MRALVVASLLLVAGAASAGEPVLALIVGNNRSQDSARPDLRYADDDALKYAQLFDTVTPGAHVEVLTRVDPASERLFPRSGARPPTRAALDAAVARLAHAARVAREAGQRPQLYFVFAGHGDAREGRGHLELEDGLLGHEELEGVIAAIAADRTHVVLDSCNSFFVVHPRRPGGQVRAARPVGARLGDERVGVLLSTSSDAQVFEWSRLQSGVFSHVVRSGLFGAADADGDRRVTYRELESFVRVAAQGIPNEDLRPQVYFNAPADADVLLDLREARGRDVELVGFSGRATIRDANGVRLLDVNPEPGFSPRVVLPDDLALSVIAELVDVDGRRRLFDVPVEGKAARIAAPRARPVDAEDEPLSPRWLPADAPRGYGQLMQDPFGPGAIRALPPASLPARGVSVEADARVRDQLQLLAGRARDERVMSAAMSGVGAASMVAAGGMMIVNEALGGAEQPTAGLIGGSAFLVAGTAMAAVATYAAIQPEPVERTFEGFEAAPASSAEERAARVDRAWLSLSLQADQARQERWVAGLALGSLSLAEAVLGGVMLVDGVGGGGGDTSALLGAGILSVGAVGVAASVLQLSYPSEVERSMALIAQDPSLELDAE